MQSRSANAARGKESATLAYSSVMRLASLKSRGDDPSFDRLVTRIRKTLADSNRSSAHSSPACESASPTALPQYLPPPANSSTSNSPTTPTSPASSSGSSPEASSAASTVIPGGIIGRVETSQELSRFAERASSPRRRSRPRPEVSSAPAPVPKPSPTREFQYSDNATPARVDQRERSPEELTGSNGSATRSMSPGSCAVSSRFTNPPRSNVPTNPASVKRHSLTSDPPARAHSILRRRPSMPETETKVATKWLPKWLGGHQPSKVVTFAKMAYVREFAPRHIRTL